MRVHTIGIGNLRVHIIGIEKFSVRIIVIRNLRVRLIGIGNLRVRLIGIDFQYYFFQHTSIGIVYEAFNFPLVFSRINYI